MFSIVVLKKEEKLRVCISNRLYANKFPFPFILVTKMSAATNGPEFLLIGCGLPRTGTLSTKHALEVILPGKCYHMRDAFQHEDQWSDIISGKSSDQEFAAFFKKEGYVAAVDAPFCFHYKRALVMFPEAKVLLNVRDPVRWTSSVKETILVSYDMPFPINIFNDFRLFTSYLALASTLFSAMKNSSDFPKLISAVRSGNGVEYWHDWISDVESTVPSDRLLKFNVRDGWEPLCRFLNVPVPDIEFPNVNQRSMFTDRTDLRRRKAWLLVYEILSMPVCCYLIYKGL